MMRIIYDLFRDGLSAINTAADDLAVARQQVATGRRISRASDDPLASQQAIGEHATLATLDAYTRANASAASRLGAIDNILNGVVDKITAALVAGSSARGSNIDATARSAAAAQIRGLRDSLLGDFNTQFNGTYLFSGTAAGTPAYAQAGGTWTYQGNSETTGIEIENGRVVSTTVDGQRIAQGSASTDLFTTLDTLADAVEAGDNDAIAAALASLDAAFDRATAAQGRLGADESGVDSAIARLAAMRTIAETRRSKLEDADLAESVTRLTAATNAYQAALGAVSTAERHSLLDYLR
jgi:flagellar hook-associated protein 3 FlgL